MSAWWRDSQSVPAFHSRPSSTEGSVFIGTLEARSFRATLQYYMVLSSATPALSSTTSAFVHMKNRGLFVLMYEDYPPSLSSLVPVPRTRRLSSHLALSEADLFRQTSLVRRPKYGSIGVSFRLSACRLPCPPWCVTVRVFKHLRPSPTEGSVFVGKHVEGKQLRANS